ncbi:hypothetical protein [Natronorubrum texcoconense]|uniref:Uncharacterized protein n=1 Tax=Natronorubrum texcoconense TaxID=1095776 RepID=A0A1G8YVH1_9EURY|nr:hypothetical protein [Natronorubrum texcoconense]SDK06773.1 hypothetical protein SAMN04515672_2318 [Natronorubrum texcoconense]
MNTDDGEGAGLSGQREWFRFGVSLAFLYAAFTLGVFYLLRVDQTIALVGTVGASLAFGIAITVYVRYLT